MWPSAPVTDLHGFIRRRREARLNLEMFGIADVISFVVRAHTGRSILVNSLLR